MTKQEIRDAFDGATFADEATLKQFITDCKLNVDATALAAAASLDDKKTLVSKAIDAIVEPAAPAPFDFAAAMAEFAEAAKTAETPAERAKRIVNELKAKPGNAIIEDCKVLKTVLTQRDGYLQVSLSIHKPLPTIDGAGKLIPIYAVTDTVISINAVLTLCGYGDVIDWIMSHNGALASLLSDATIDIVTDCVRKGDTYSNPFSTSDREFTAKSNRINHYIYNIELGERGLREVEAIHDAQRCA